MSDSIPMHPKYGLNATIPICAFCGQEKNEIAILGANYNGEVPKSMIVNFEPCNDCKNIMEQGFTIIEVESKENPLPHAWAVIDTEKMDEFLSHFKLTEQQKSAFKKHKLMLTSIGTLKKFFGDDYESKHN